ncbi:MAG: DNA gyrase inhibitor YacG [Mariprofundaceae bacterium]|nr:DNA gyrase inhibitor YacG [Mariprofundaceae bacterium]
MTRPLKKTCFTCPTCKAELERSNKSFPFCSERCQIIDLGCWADGSYSIAGDPVPSSESDEGYSTH